MDGIEETAPLRFVLDCHTARHSSFIWRKKLPSVQHLGIHGGAIHVSALTPGIRALHSTGGFASDTRNDVGEYVVDLDKVANIISELEVFVVRAVDTMEITRGCRGLQKLKSLKVIDFNIHAFELLTNDLDLRMLENLRAVHIESDMEGWRILLPRTVETFADLDCQSFICDETFDPAGKVHAIALNGQWIDHARTSSWWFSVWASVRVGAVVLNDEPSDPSVTPRKLPRGPSMTLFVHAPCSVHLGDAIDHLRVFAERAYDIRVVREFDYEYKKGATGTYENDAEMLEAIRAVCPQSRVGMHTTEEVDNLWKILRPFMKPPSITMKEWETTC